MRCLLVDDEPLARERLQALLDEAEANINILAEAGSGKEAVSLIHEHDPELVFLDVQMPVLDGFDVVDLLPEARPHIVFVTAYDEYAIQAFEVHALDYLTKPVRLDRLNETLRRAEEALETDPSGAIDDLREARADESLKRLTVHIGRRLRVVPLDEVRWIGADEGLVFAHTTDGRYRTDFTLSELEQRLPSDQFVRIHRSTIVNLDEMYELVPQASGTYKLRLQDGTELQVARRRAEHVKQALGR